MAQLLSDKDYKSLSPNTDPFSIDDMPADAKPSFLVLTSAYRSLLTKYLIEKISLKKYDNIFLNSNLKYLPVSVNEMDVYQWFSHEELSFLYLRNNIYIFNLSREERADFLTMLRKSDALTFKMKRFIQSTFQKAIFEKTKVSPCNINYGPISPTFMAPNNSLVIGMRYDEFNLNGMSDEDWGKNHDLKMEQIFDVSQEIEALARKKLQVECRVIKYDEFSIITRK